MAIPKYPEILKEANWSKNKGLLTKTAGATGVSAQMKLVQKKYAEIKWEIFDVSKTLKGGATGDQARLALAAAKKAYEERVKPLVTEIDRLSFKAEDAAKKFKSATTVSKTSVDHALKVMQAAKLFSAQVESVSAEFAAFEKVVASTTVEDAIGKAWFDALAQVNFYKNVDVIQWTRAVALAISSGDGKMDSEISQILEDAAAEIQLFKTNTAKLLAMRDKRAEKRAAITAVAKLWREASDSFFVMKPGLQGLHRQVAVRQNNLAGSKEKYLAWEKENRRSVDLHKKVERILFSEEAKINPLDEHIDRIAR